MRIYLIRHAHTEIVADQPAAEWELSPKGLSQAEAVANLPFWPEVRAIYSSPEAKALQTAAGAARRFALPVVVVEELKELERPAGLSPDYFAAVQACFGAPEQSVQGWEPAAQVQRRMLQALTTLPAGDGPVAVVSHGLSYALFFAALAGKAAPSLEEWRSIPMPGWAALEMPEGKLVEPWFPVETP